MVKSENPKILSGTEKQCKKQQKWAKMAKNETEFGLYVALNYFSHLPLCLSEKIRRCFKSFDNLEKTCDFFCSLAETDYHYCGVRRIRTFWGNWSVFGPYCV